MVDIVKDRNVEKLGTPTRGLLACVQMKKLFARSPMEGKMGNGIASFDRSTHSVDRKSGVLALADPKEVDCVVKANSCWALSC